MSKNKKLLIILIILLAAAYIYNGPFQDWRANRGKPGNFLGKIDAADIAKIEITKAGESVALEKQGDKWLVLNSNNFYVKDSVASQLENALIESKNASVNLAGANKDKKMNFQTDENGIMVRLFDQEKELANFIIGKLAGDYASTYISLPESDETYSIGVNLAGPFNQSDWRDNTIFANNIDDINFIRFQYPNNEIKIEKQGDEWKGVNPYEFNADSEKLKAALDIMSNLTAVKIPEQTFEGTGLEKNLIIVQVTGNNIDNTLMVGEANDQDQYYVKRAINDNIFLISKAQRDELDKQVADLQ
jgi:hypothetical protein